LSASIALNILIAALGWFWYLWYFSSGYRDCFRLGGQAMADRYAYLPFIGLFIIVTCGEQRISSKKRNIYKK